MHVLYADVRHQSRQKYGQVLWIESVSSVSCSVSVTTRNETGYRQIQVKEPRNITEMRLKSCVTESNPKISHSPLHDWPLVFLNELLLDVP